MTAGVMTPLLTSLLLGALVPVDTRALVVTTLQVVLLPVILGLLANTYVLPRLKPAVTRQLNRATPVLSGTFGLKLWLWHVRHLLTTPIKTNLPANNKHTGLLVAAICGKVISANANAVAQAGLPLLLAVISLHTFGFLFG
jgi:predicted Na+-dependent transporter